MKHTGRLEVRRSVLHTWFSFFWLLLYTLVGVGLLAIGEGPLFYAGGAFSLLAAALLCYALLSRLSVARSLLAASQLAMGSRRRDIFAFFGQYAFYAALHGFLLGGVGAVVALFFSPAIAELPTFGSRFNQTLNAFSLLGWLLAGGAAILLLLVAAWLACRPLLTKPVRELLTQSAVPTGRRLRTPFSALARLGCHLPQSLVAVMAVAGCTLLFILTLSGYTFLEKAEQRQFQLLDHFQVRLDFDPEPPAEGEGQTEGQVVGQDEGDGEAAAMEEYISTELALSRFLAQRDLDFLPLCSRELYWNRQQVTLLAAASGPVLAPLLTLRDASSGTLLELPQEGVLLSANLAWAWQAKTGDVITVSDAGGQPLTLTVAGVFEYYLPEMLLLTGYDQYQVMFDQKAQANSFFIRFDQADVSRLRAQVRDQAGYVAWTDYRQAGQELCQSRQAALLPWWVGLSGAGAMVLILVVVNLNAAALRERARELTLLRVQGYSLAETGSGLFQDQLLRLLLGLLLGLLLALFIRGWVLPACGCVGPLLLRTTLADCCLLGLAAAALLGLVLSFLSLLRLRRLRLTRLNQNGH